jgi:hypothetical protein
MWCIDCNPDAAPSTPRARRVKRCGRRKERGAASVVGRCIYICMSAETFSVCAPAYVLSSARSKASSTFSSSGVYEFVTHCGALYNWSSHGLQYCDLGRRHETPHNAVVSFNIMAICLGGLGVKAHHTFLRIHQLEPYSNFYFQAIGTKMICYVMTGNTSKTQKP